VIAITPLADRHLDRLLELEQEVSIQTAFKRPPYDRAALLELLEEADPDRACFAIEEAVDGQVAARVIGWLELRAVRVSGFACGSFEIYLDPACQGRGVGREVVAQLPAMVRARFGLDVVLIGVFEDNKAALRLYERLGYVEVDRQWHYPERGDRQRWLMLSNKPERFVRRRVGFGQP